MWRPGAVATPGLRPLLPPPRYEHTQQDHARACSLISANTGHDRLRASDCPSSPQTPPPTHTHVHVSVFAPCRYNLCKHTLTCTHVSVCSVSSSRALTCALLLGREEEEEESHLIILVMILCMVAGVWSLVVCSFQHSEHDVKLNLAA
jgi:hypothetical protein